MELFFLPIFAGIEGPDMLLSTTGGLESSGLFPPPPSSGLCQFYTGFVFNMFYKTLRQLFFSDY